MGVEELVYFLDHPEMFCSEGAFDWQNTMAISGDESAFVMNVFHDVTHDDQGIDLFVDWIYLDEA